MSNRIQVRRDTAANWTTTNPVLAAGEPALETDTGRRKTGDGTTAWTALPYVFDKTIADATYTTPAAANAAISAQTKTVLPSGDTTGVTDLAAINTALSTSPVVLQRGATYYFNGPIVGKRLDATGATLAFVASYTGNLYRTPALNGPAGTATDGTVNAGSNVVTTSLASIAVIGQTIQIEGAGNGGYNPLTGIVSATSAGTITVAKHDGSSNAASLIALSQRITAGASVSAIPVIALAYPVSAGNVTLTLGALTQTFATAGAAVGATAIPVTTVTASATFTPDAAITAPCALTGCLVTLRTRDTGIRLIGGYWKRLSSASGTVYMDNLNLCVKHADDVVVDIEGGYSRGGKFFVCAADLTNYAISARNLDCWSDGVDLQGPMSHGTVDHVTGLTGDDSLSILCANGHSGSPFDTCGDIVDLTVGDVDTISQVGNFKIIAGAGVRADKIKVTGRIAGSAAHDVAWVGDDPSGQFQMLGGAYGDIDLGTVTAVTADPSGARAMLRLYTPDARSIRVFLSFAGIAKQHGVAMSQQGNRNGTIDRLTVDGSFNLRLQASTQSLIYAGTPGYTINEIVDTTYYDNPSPALTLGGGTVGHYRKIGGYTSGSYLATITTVSAALGRLTVEGGVMNVTNAILREATTSDISVSLGGGLVVNGNVNLVSLHGTAGTCRITLGAMRYTGSGQLVYVSGKTVSITGGSSLTLDASPTIIQRAASETVYALPGCTLPLDLAMLSKSVVGGSALDANARTGSVGQVISSGSGATGSWKNLYTGATY